MKKGFTLIELLAVIVILAIIALIATPVILNIIDSSRESTQSITAQNYKKAIENSLAKKELNKEHVSNGSYEIMEDGNLCLSKLENGLCENNDILKIETEGERPKKGYVEILNNSVHNLIIYINGYKITIDSKGIVTVAKISDGTVVCTLEEKSTIETDLNYTGYNKGDKIQCGTESFYVIETSNNTVSMLAEYNLNLGKSWIDTIDEYDGIEIKQSKDNPSEIAFVQIQPYIDAYGEYLSNIGVSDFSLSLMTYAQAASFGCEGVCDYNSNYSFECEKSCDSNYSWIYSNSYWLSDMDDESYAYCIINGYNIISAGYIYGMSCGEYQCDGYSFYGIRPVLTLPISQIE